MFKKFYSRSYPKRLMGPLAPLALLLVACGAPPPLVQSPQFQSPNVITEEKAVMVFAGQPELELVDFTTQRSFQRFINRFHMTGDGHMRIQVKSQIEDGIKISERIRKLRKFLTRSGLTDKNIVELPVHSDDSAAAILSFSIKPPADTSG